MKQVDMLIATIKEWQESRTTDVNDITTLLGLLLFKTGSQDSMSDSFDDLISNLNERINYLLSTENFDEDFLVISLVNQFTELLEHTIDYHGKFIITNEEFLNLKEDQDRNMDFIKDKLEELKDPSFRIGAIKELDDWLILVAQNFNKTNREEWDGKRFLENAESVKKSFYDNIPEKVRHILLNMPIGKINEVLSSGIDLDNLSVEEAEQLRQELMNK
ncbi:MAG: hypothetical protein ACOCRO_04895 [Halanaerobiales bacterium]